MSRRQRCGERGAQNRLARWRRGLAASQHLGRKRAKCRPSIDCRAIDVNWIVWLPFCTEFLGKLTVAPDRHLFVRRSWFDLLLVVLAPPFLVPDALQGSRAVRALRRLRFVRAVAAIGFK